MVLAYLPFAAQLAEPDEIDGLAGDGGEIHLEVAGEDDKSRRGTDGQGTGFGYGLVVSDEFVALGGAGLDGITGLYGIQLALVQDAVLFELAADQPNGEGGAVHRGLDLLEQEGQGADVVLVPVGEENAPDLAGIFLQIGEIGDNEIHAGQVVIREGGAAVHDDDILLRFKNGQVLADLAQSAQGDDLQWGTAGTVRLFAAGGTVGLRDGSGRGRLFGAAFGGLLFGRRGGLFGLSLGFGLGGLGRLLRLFRGGVLPLGGLALPLTLCGGGGLFRLAFALPGLVFGLRPGLLGCLRRLFGSGLLLGGRGFFTHHTLDLRCDFSGGFGAAVLAEILPKYPVLLFTGCFGRCRSIILFFSLYCSSCWVRFW